MGLPAQVGIGIVSFAHGHVNAYADQIRRFGDARLIACWDHDEDRGRRGAQAFDIPFYQNLEKLLSNPQIECVIVASETNRHADLAVAAMEAGKAVLLQKPMATTIADCDRIVECSERTGVWFSIAFQMRCDPMNSAMRELLQRNAIGRLGMVRRRHCIGVLFDRGFVESGSRWHISAEQNRGMFFDDAIHPIDWMLWTLGRSPISVTAEIDNVLTDVAPDDTGVAIFRFEDGLFAEIFNSSVTRAGECTTEIYGEGGVIIQNYGDGPSCSILPPGAVGLKMFQTAKPEAGWQILDAEIPKGQGARIAAVARPFINALKSGTSMCTAREGRLSVQLCLAAYESAALGRRITLSY